MKSVVVKISEIAKESNFNLSAKYWLKKCENVGEDNEFQLILDNKLNEMEVACDD